MQSITPAAARTARSRPRAVSAAVWIMYAGAALMLAYGLVQVALIGDFERAAEQAAAGTDMAGSAAGDARNTAILALLVGAINAGILVWLAFMCGRGRTWARILVWIGAGLLVLRAIEGLALWPVLARSFRDKPGWYQPATVANIVLSLVLAVVVAILLALPSSRPFFRKQPATYPVPGYQETAQLSPGGPPPSDPAGDAAT